MSSTVRYESHTTIDRPVEEVFARLADLPAYSNLDAPHRLVPMVPPDLGRPDRSGDDVSRRHQDGNLPR